MLSDIICKSALIPVALKLDLVRYGSTSCMTMHSEEEQELRSLVAFHGQLEGNHEQQLHHITSGVDLTSGLECWTHIYQDQ